MLLPVNACKTGKNALPEFLRDSEGLPSSCFDAEVREAIVALPLLLCAPVVSC
jgi:hypothetical protein